MRSLHLLVLLGFSLIATAQQAKPYVVVVALGGFRYDATLQHGAKHLSALMTSGAAATGGMIPAYPAQTLPNLYTLLTGLSPQHHGIVADRFYDPARKQFFSSDSDGSWYAGTPLWVLAEQQGTRSACISWPGCDVEIDGVRPSYHLKSSGQKPVDPIIDWLQLPPGERPHLIVLYLPAVDQPSREYGPDSPQAAAAIKQADQLVGDLWARLGALQLPIDLFVLSDHGMEREQGPWIDLSQYTSLANFTTAGPLLYPPSEAAAEKAYQELKIRTDAFKVYRRKFLPAALHDDNPRLGDPVIVANGPYAIRVHPDAQPPDPGVSGYDPAIVPGMRALFLAVGPDIRSGVKLQPFDNVNLYPLLAGMLGLEAPHGDGALNILSKILKKPLFDEGP